tara:strand:+ start:324 stop:551 length:228 start_codon:yes stop_codon:yes gene_type:complete
LEWSHEKLKSNSDVDVIIKDGKPVNKEIFRPTNRFKELDKERRDSQFATFIADPKKTLEAMGKIHNKLKTMGAFE